MLDTHKFTLSLPSVFTFGFVDIKPQLLAAHSYKKTR